jgi:high affinity sulfate transporter 1
MADTRTPPPPPAAGGPATGGVPVAGTKVRPAPPLRGLAALMPGIATVRTYRRSWLRGDLVAGIILSTLLVPAGMGYAEAAGLPAITGLYATIVPLIAYAIFGPSRILVLGPDSALAAVIAATILPLSAGDPDRAIALASALGIIVGLLCIGAGIARLGFVTDLLSKPVRVEYMNGFALTVILSQLPKLFGFSVAADGAIPELVEFVRQLLAGATEPVALAIGLMCLAIILVLRRVEPRIPGVLVAVVVATIIVSTAGLAGTISVVGTVPQGLPMPSIPAVSLADLGALVTGAVGIALVAFADTSVLSRTFAARNGYRVDPDDEVRGLGIANLAGGFFQGFPVSSSASRTPVAESAGSRTQLTGVVGALVIAALLVFAPSLLQNVPSTALAAVVIAAVLGLFDVRSIAGFAVMRRTDAALAIACFLGVVIIGVIPGILIAVALSLLDFVRRAWAPHDAVMGRAEGVKGYHDVTRYPDAKQIPGLLLYRWDAPLFFANADTFRERIVELVDAAEIPVRWVVVAAEPITDVDTTAADAIAELDTELEARGAELAFAEMKDPVKDRLQRYGLGASIGREFFFPTIGAAVHAYVEQAEVPWIDWEDAATDAPPVASS